MRFAILVVGGVATGALSAGAIQTMMPHTGPMFQAVRALGGNLADFKITEINPLKAYEDVKRQITSGNYGGSINFGASTPVPAFSNVGNLSLSGGVKIDEAAMKRAIAAGVNARIQQDYRRSQDLAAYGRNPMGWHGAPP